MNDLPTVVGTATHADEDGSSPLGREEALHAGTLIDRYVLVARLGAGGMGVVWAAYDPELDRRVAIKLLLPQRRDGEAGRIRLLREAQALAKLNHPNIVSIYDVGTWEQQVWIAMEFVEGQTLGAWAHARPRRWREVLACLRSAGEGLAAAHAKGLIHRDFKPDNVMVGDDARVRVMDFGLARSEGEEEPDAAERSAREISELSTSAPSKRALQTTLTVAGAFMGTPAYMAAELYAGGEADQRSDQFAFCVTAWELLYGSRPFAGQSIAQLSLAVCEGTREPVPREAAVPKWVQALLERGLELDPSRRWPSMDALLEALSQDPSVTRRRVAAGLTLIALIAGALGWVQFRRARTIAACEQDSQALAARWSPQVRAQAETALLDTGRAYASDAWTRTRTHIDTYIDDWTQARSRVCVASEVEGTLDASTAALATSCLGQREASLAALIDLLTQGGDDTSRRALESAISLPALARCEDEAWLRRQPPPPSPTIEAQAEQLRRRIHDARMRAALGRHEQALDEVRALSTQAGTLAWTPLEAEVALAQGVVLQHSGDYAEAADALEQAFTLAAGIGHDEVATEATIQLTYILAQHLARYDEGLRWAELGAIFVRRSGNQGGLLDAAHKNALAMLQRHLDEFDAAVANNLTSLELWRELLGEQHPLIGRSLNNLGSTYNVMARREDALASLRQSLAISEAIYGPAHPEVASPLNNLGNLLLARGDYQGAHEHFARALAIREDAFGPEHPRTAFCLNNVGTVLLRLDRMDEGVALLKRTIEIREATLGPEHPQVATTRQNLGYAYLELEQPALAVEQFERAVEIREASVGPQHHRSAYARRALGKGYVSAGSPERAVPLLLEAIEVLAAKQGQHAPAVAGARVDLAEARLTLGELDAAREQIDAALESFAHSEGSERELGSTYFILARIHEARGDRGASERALQKARQRYTQAGADGPLARVEAWTRARAPQP